MLAGCARSVPNGRIVSSCCVRGRSSRRNAVRLAVSSLAPSSEFRVSVRAKIGLRRSRRGAKSSVVSCNLFARSSGCGESEDEDGDYLEASLLLEGEYAVEKLIEAIQQGETAECPDQFQFVGDFTEKVGCNMVMIRLTKRLVNTYFARIFFSEPGKTDLLSVDIRPSDAINVAYRCKIPIFVHKQIVFTDAVKLAYGRERVRDAKPVYDVTLDRWY